VCCSVLQSISRYKYFLHPQQCHSGRYTFQSCQVGPQILSEPNSSDTQYDMTHSDSVATQEHDSFRIWYDSFICVTGILYMCDTTHSYVWHDSSICVTWLIHMCDVTHLYVRHEPFVCATWLVHTRGMTNLYMWHASFKGNMPHLRFTSPSCQGTKHILWGQ